ncbi:hypothetical protein BANRA_03829 [Acinetobacter baumannii]|nr:hypothetical protein BANRA_03829 [Acinetobacter baumannii]
MNICVGGELDGQVIEKEGRLLKASDIDPSFKTEYYKQIYNRDNTVFHFWLPIGSDLHDMSEKVLTILRAPKTSFIVCRTYYGTRSSATY